MSDIEEIDQIIKSSFYFPIKSRLIRYLPAIVALLCFISGCATSQPPPQKPAGYPKPYKVFGKWYQPLPDSKDFRQRGIASWYGKDFHGKKTSNGEIYDMYAMTAAHKTLPLGTYVRVHNLENNRKLEVRINDRGPFVRGRIIDLSYTAAKNLDSSGPARPKSRLSPWVRLQPPTVSRAAPLFGETIIRATLPFRSVLSQIVKMPKGLNASSMNSTKMPISPVMTVGIRYFTGFEWGPLKPWKMPS
jgi:hypothetical protein